MIIDFAKQRRRKIPFKNPWVLPILFFLFILSGYFFIDKGFAVSVHSLHPEIRGVLLSIYDLTSPSFVLLVCIFLFFLIRFIQRREKKSRKILCLIVMLGLCIFLSSILQVLLGRASPEWFFLHREMVFRPLNWNPYFHSFPSTYSVAASGCMTTLSILYRSKKVLFLTLAFLLGIIPALLCMCFFSDAVAGIAIGVLVSHPIFSLLQRELSL